MPTGAIWAIEALRRRKDQTRMTDEINETPIQRALRLKKQALDAKPKPPRGGRFQREQAAAAQSSSKSKPWMSR